MITLHHHPDASSLLDLKTQYLQSLVAPMDGMWEVGLINPSPHWEIKLGGDQAGYYAANDEGDLLQFYVQPTFEKHARALFDHVIAQTALKQAVVSTIDPSYLSSCLDVQRKVTVHTYLYESHAEIRPSDSKTEDDPDFRLIEAPELDRTISFQRACLGGDTDLTWLSGYSANLIERKELFVLGQEDEWLGIGECRRSDSQEGVADLGMMVSPAHRRKGWATHILTRLRVQSTAHRLRPICSTTVENIAAQKAIVRSGFISRHRIITVAF